MCVNVIYAARQNVIAKFSITRALSVSKQLCRQLNLSQALLFYLQCIYCSLIKISVIKPRRWLQEDETILQHKRHLFIPHKSKSIVHQVVKLMQLCYISLKSFHSKINERKFFSRKWIPRCCFVCYLSSVIISQLELFSNLIFLKDGIMFVTKTC